tara:strand:+ start:3612 stop:3866 length:255 start_codon:yes stop_codon:yes gene_type:complete
MRTNWEYVWDRIADSFETHLGDITIDWDAEIYGDTAMQFVSLRRRPADYYAIESDVFEIERTEDWKMDVMIHGDSISVTAVYNG